MYFVAWLVIPFLPFSHVAHCPGRPAPFWEFPGRPAPFWEFPAVPPASFGIVRYSRTESLDLSVLSINAKVNRSSVSATHARGLEMLCSPCSTPSVSTNTDFLVYIGELPPSLNQPASMNVDQNPDIVASFLAPYS